MTETTAISAMARIEARRRRLDQWLMIVPYAALVASTALVRDVGDAADRAYPPYPVVVATAAITAAWIAWWVTLHPRWENDRRRMAIFFVGLLVLIFLLVWCTPFYGFFAWTGYLYTAYALRGRWRVVGATGVAIATGLSQAGGFPVLGQPGSWGFAGMMLLFNVVIANVMMMLSTMIRDQYGKRVQMVDELAETNAKLAAALRENAGLHAQLVVQAREAGIHDERQRMAGEIHDVLAQGLTGIVTQLEAASAQSFARSGGAQRHLDAAKKLARDSLAEARRSVQALRPQTLDNSALPEAIGEVITGWSKLNGVKADLIMTGTPRHLLPEIETTLLRTAQEALANVARHARAGRVTLTLSYMEDMVTLDVRDDGAGFNPSTPPAPGYEGGFGLSAMRERLSRIAGTLEVESEPGAGTALSACVPALGVAA